MTNTAQDVLWPADSNILVRVAILHVGQGASAVVFAAEGGTYKTLLLDINLDSKANGIDVPKMMKDLVGSNGLGVFVNSHPHNDHLCGVTELADAVKISEVWHSGHVPGKDDRAAYDNLQKVIKKVKNAGGTETELKGSDSAKKLGEAEYYVLAPAQHVKDDIADETEEGRRKRIHEHCAVLKFGSGSKWIMLPGDADRDAWETHITKHHQDRLSAVVLAGAHHGSRTFFKHDEDEDPYLDALQGIAPERVILSAPRQKESPHGHPHDDAVELYEDEVGEENVLLTGKKRYAFICDIYRSGKFDLHNDGGKLVKAYPYSTGDDGGGKGESKQGPSSLGRSSSSDVRVPPPFAAPFA